MTPSSLKTVSRVLQVVPWTEMSSSSLRRAAQQLDQDEVQHSGKPSTEYKGLLNCGPTNSWQGLLQYPKENVSSSSVDGFTNTF